MALDESFHVGFYDASIIKRTAMDKETLKAVTEKKKLDFSKARCLDAGVQGRDGPGMVFWQTRDLN